MQSKHVAHEVMLKFHHIFLFSFPGYEFSPRTQQVFYRYDIVEGMSSPSLLPVIEHILGVYKTWYGYRDAMPKKSRYTLGDKIDLRFVQVLELLYAATYQAPAEKAATLQRALSGIDTIKFLLRVAWELRVFDDKKYATLSEGIEEAGRQVGGWRKGLQIKTSATKAEENK